MQILEVLSNEFSLTNSQIEAVIALIDDGNTIPFIARYRKEATGGMDDVTLRKLDERLTYLRNLENRKEEVIRLIDEQGKLTDELEAQIRKAEVLQRVEDLYKPYKQKRATRASKARERGLQPLADLIVKQEIRTGFPEDFAKDYISEELGVPDAESALQGACDIIAENISDDADITAAIRDVFHKQGLLNVSALEIPAESETGEKAEAYKKYENYYDFSESVSRIPNHRILAVNRGENEKILKVKAGPTPETEERVYSWLNKRVNKGNSIFTDLLTKTSADSYKRLIAPSLEREIRTELTQRAETAAIGVFAQNLEGLLMTPPVNNARVIAVDPGYRTGCKIAVLDENGKLLDFTTVYPTPPRKDVSGTQRVLKTMIAKHNINVIVIGNGTASRETEEVVADFIKTNNPDIKYTIVNEAGASVYSASELASSEYPDLDVTTRGAMSLGRRLQDPLAELVKIPPRSIGVGQYQHDLNQTSLNRELAAVVENVVNRVGVDLNTASASLLGYVSGINSSIAKNIVAYREENGGFTERKQLKKVPKLGAKAFEQCAGFLRIADGKEPLDSTSVHPESYKAAKGLLTKLGVTLVNGGVPDIDDRLTEYAPDGSSGTLKLFSEELEIGLPTLIDIVAEIKKPARDPRDDAPAVVFNRDVRDFDDLEVGMELTGTVRNVTDFGAFIDIGVKQDGLVHISKMAKRFIKHPAEIVSVGDNVTVWITNVEKSKHKIGLSMVGV
ncbi:MAG: RNA-binding transcriptional accessory protein [Oscillospiraceae bacterium]|jgi:uncharacterized protein|nr:RNA-binding transcriptional accessory protein [Oscillospiraceae bacterium]